MTFVRIADGRIAHTQKMLIGRITLGTMTLGRKKLGRMRLGRMECNVLMATPLCATLSNTIQFKVIHLIVILPNVVAQF